MAYTKEVQCEFKGDFMLYENNANLQDKFSTFLQRNDNSFFKLSPPSGAVRVKLHVYVIKASIYGSMNSR